MIESRPKVSWQWPPAMFTRKDLTDAMKAGFALHVSYTERGNTIYRLSRDGITAPIGILQQSVAHRAYSIGVFVRGVSGCDGWRPLTLKPKGGRG